MAASMLLASFASPVASFAQAQDQSQVDARAFTQTGFRIDRDSFWDYFSHRGRISTFGYPVSRDFQFEGCTAQFFQRLILQQCGTNGVGTMNLLDDGLLPYTHMNGSTFPASDSFLTALTPKVSDSNYASSILGFVRTNAVDTFDGQKVNFQSTFFNTISADVGGTDDPNILGLLDLEIWGAPTSKPAYDPSNHNFIYQRFQRGIMHYDATCGCTQGLLLADYLKALITGQNLPGDLAAQAANSPLLRSATNGKAPFGTSYGNAFVQGNGSATAGVQEPALLPLPTTPITTLTTTLPTTGVPLTGVPSTTLLLPGGTPLPPPPPVSSPDYGLSMFLWGQPNTSDRDL